MGPGASFRTSILTLYRTLFALRKATPALNVGRYATVPTPVADCFVYERTDGTDRYLIALNFSDEPQTLSLSGSGTCLLSTHLDRTGEADLQALSLRPHEGVIVKL